MGATIYNIEDDFNRCVYGVGTSADAGTAGVMVILRPQSSQKALITDIQFGVRWSSTYNANGAATEIKVASGDIWVLEGNLAAIDLPNGLANFFDATTAVATDTIKRFGLRVLLCHRYNNYNLTPLNHLNILGKSNKTLYVLMNTPAFSANASGAPMDVTLAMTVFGSYQEQDTKMSPVVFEH